MKLTQTKLILLASFFFVAFDNLAFFRHVLAVYPLSVKNIGFLASLAVGLTCVITLFLTLITSRYTLKLILITLLFAAAFAGYFMNNYNVVIDATMIDNILQTDIGESSELLSLKLIVSLFLFGLLPTMFIFTADIERVSWRRSLIARMKVGGACVVVVFAMVLCFSKFYTSFFREHKPLRYYTNPTYSIYSAGKYISENLNTGTVVVASLGEDARAPEGNADRQLIILVVGEAARADHFSLNGYPRETNPLLAREDVISMSAMYSCGTSTAHSVPCMFSIYGRDQYSNRKAESTENLLDVLQHAEINVLWRDNNSDSKGVALRVAYQDYQKPNVNPVCDSECRDEGMLVGLQEYIDGQEEGDIMIVLHQMGNHGPAYYKRYPEAFEKFTPVCRTNQFDECTNEEIVNAYDNAILYTDYFLSEVITLLKENDNSFETAMVYLSDHGESLGEYGVYLHGLPYAMAPEAQKHVAALFWLGEHFDADVDLLRQRASLRYSQDNLFHTILGMMEVETEVYEQNMDIVPGDNTIPVLQDSIVRNQGT